MERKEYVTVKELPKFFPIFTERALRHLIHENRNGIHECMKRVGHRLFFDIQKFQDWMDKQSMETKE